MTFAAEGDGAMVHAFHASFNIEPRRSCSWDSFRLYGELIDDLRINSWPNGVPAGLPGHLQSVMGGQPLPLRCSSGGMRRTQGLASSP